MKNKLPLYSLIIALVFSTLVFLLHNNSAFVNFENKSLDWRFKLRGQEPPKSPVVVAEIDVDALESIGKWPWRRSIHADLVRDLTNLGAKAVVFDVMFYEPDNDRPEDDIAFGREIKKSGRTVSSVSFTERSIDVTDEEGYVIGSELRVIKDKPLDQIIDSSKAIGFVNIEPDSDGVVRRPFLTLVHDGKKYASLNLQAMAVATGKGIDELIQGLPLLDGNLFGYDDYPTKNVMINFRGQQIPEGRPEDNTFPTFSCDNILGVPIEFMTQSWIDEMIKDKIILIGSTALGLYDHYNIPFQSQFPGVFVHANIIDNLWANDFLTPVSGLLTLLLIFAFGLGTGIFVPRVSAWVGAVAVLSIAGGFWIIGYYLMAKKLIYIELVAPTVSIIGSYISVFFYRFIVEQKEKAGIKKAFGVYVNPHVVEQIAKNPDGLKLGGEMREMTVMFSDVAGFTTISEKLSPQELVQLLNLYLTSMTDTIMKYDGTVDKYEGDAIMAFWGAPLIQPNHGKRACTAVLENRDRLKELNEELEKKGMLKLHARCGLNTGPMNVGNMGSSQKFNYTVMGDSVNLASRLEGANKQYGTYLMVSESTYTAAKDEIEVRELDLLRVKGKAKPIKVFELLSKKGELTDSQKRGIDLYNEGFDLYRKRNFKEAQAKFQEVMDHLPNDGPSETYINRAKDYIKTPPPSNWDGVFVMTTK